MPFTDLTKLPEKFIFIHGSHRISIGQNSPRYWQGLCPVGHSILMDRRRQLIVELLSELYGMVEGDEEFGGREEIARRRGIDCNGGDRMYFSS